MNESKYISIFNFSKSVKIDEIPVLTYDDFSSQVKELLSDTANHCVNYFAFPFENRMKFICCIARDSQGDITVFSHEQKNAGTALPSLTTSLPQMHIFEQEIYENFGVVFEDHPWMKPVRFPNGKMDDYPFYKIEGDELHEVGVGPVHAGVIEPGHFRFICNGENVLHLEIQLGWQHRGVEALMLEKKQLLQRVIISESIAGDTAVGHSLAFAQLMETLGDIKISEQLMVERAIALELERIAIHVGDIAALCTDVSYGLGANIFAILRTGIINYTQSWCGNRLGKGMIRPGGINLPFTNDHKERLLEVLSKFEFQFVELAHRTYKLSSVENRFDDIGTVDEKLIRTIGGVGMTARMANVNRDIRSSHPFAGYIEFPIAPVILPKGDVFSRFLLRRKEIKRSIAWIRNILENCNFDIPSGKPPSEIQLKPDSFAISLTEGWRGEICHCAITDETGSLMFYKIKDPSMHNWKALELSLRNLEMSEFPINNKSYNLSYCGYDL